MSEARWMMGGAAFGPDLWLGDCSALQPCPPLTCPHMAYSSLSVPCCQPSWGGRVGKASSKPSSATAPLCVPQQVSDPL